MKLNIKRTLGQLDHHNIRIPPFLKRRLESLRKRAENRDIDYTATLTATLEDFAEALEAQIDSERISEESLKNPEAISTPLQPVASNHKAEA